MAAASDAGNVLMAVHQCHAGIELVMAALSQPRLGRAEADALQATRAQLEAKMLELEAEELAQERQLFLLPDSLVGVGYPGNPSERSLPTHRTFR